MGLGLELTNIRALGTASTSTAILGGRGRGARFATKITEKVNQESSCKDAYKSSNYKKADQSNLLLKRHITIPTCSVRKDKIILKSKP